jgi:DNA polymerase elongation subunit (family B)
LYPSLIRQHNMSAETLIPRGSPRANEIHKELGSINVDTLLAQEPDLRVLKKHNVSLAANGALFDLSKDGFLPAVMNTILTSRKKVKGMMLQRQQEAENAKKQGHPYEQLLDEVAALDAQQMAFKILANSGYGAIANQHFRYFKLEIAEAITVSGQLNIKWIENTVNKYLNTILKVEKDRVIGIDTDSVLLNMHDIIKLIFPNTLPATEKVVNILDDYCKKKLNPVVDQATKDLAEYLNSKEHLVFFKREKIADKGLFIAKKRYVLSVWNNEGVTYSSPKMKIMGIEAVKSSTPEICRKAMKEAIPIILYKTLDDIKSFIDKFKDEFYNASLEDIAFPRSVNNLSKYAGTSRIYESGTPMHVRAALLYNFLVKKFNLKNEYDLIKNNDKIKFVYLKIPNPIQENVIGFTTKFPEFNSLSKYIDYETQFNKTFIDPLQTMTDLLSWNLCLDDTKQSLEEFFM